MGSQGKNPWCVRVSSTLHSASGGQAPQKETNLNQLQCVRYYLRFREGICIQLYTIYIYQIGFRQSRADQNQSFLVLNMWIQQGFLASTCRCCGASEVLAEYLHDLFGGWGSRPWFPVGAQLLALDVFFKSHLDEEGCTNQLTTIFQYHACITSIFTGAVNSYTFDSNFAHISKAVSTHLWNKPGPTGYNGIPFIVGQGDCLRCGVGVCWNNLWISQGFRGLEKCHVIYRKAISKTLSARSAEMGLVNRISGLVGQWQMIATKPQRSSPMLV